MMENMILLGIFPIVRRVTKRRIRRKESHKAIPLILGDFRD